MLQQIEPVWLYVMSNLTIIAIFKIVVLSNLSEKVSYLRGITQYLETTWQPLCLAAIRPGSKFKEFKEFVKIRDTKVKGTEQQGIQRCYISPEIGPKIWDSPSKNVLKTKSYKVLNLFNFRPNLASMR